MNAFCTDWRLPIANSQSGCKPRDNEYPKGESLYNEGTLYCQNISLVPFLEEPIFLYQLDITPSISYTIKALVDYTI